jgi:hypothetical protein
MLQFIENIGDFFTSNYFGDDFADKVLAKSGYNEEGITGFEKQIAALKERYYRYKNDYLNLSRPKDRIRRTHEWHSLLLQGLGYTEVNQPYADLLLMDSNEAVPVHHQLYFGEQPQLFIMEMQSMVRTGDDAPPGLFEQVYNRAQWNGLFNIPDGVHLTPSVINEAVTRIFIRDRHERPRYILLLAGSEVYLLNDEKWPRGSYLRLSLEDLFTEATRQKKLYAVFSLLVGKLALAPEGEMVLLDQLDEDSHKSAYSVTKDLKTGIIQAVERLANEAILYLRKSANSPGEADDLLASIDAGALKDDCLTIVYRLLFLFYAESRPELGILPDDDVYRRGYSLDMLRDLEQTPLNTEASRNGFFFHDSLTTLFRLLRQGYRVNDADNRSFRVPPLDTPLFDDNELKVLVGVRFSNMVWQAIIRQLSLSQPQKGKPRGRISYANLGINQIGSVYEGLLAYRGFFAEQDYMEVHKDGKPQEGTYLAPRIRMDDFKTGEILRDDRGEPVIHQKGTFLYRLSGRDRQQSASYYTPEELTRTTVKYTIKPILEQLREGKLKADDLLQLKILEPAQGASAFQNEVINQLAEAYLDAKQDELCKSGKKRINPSDYRDELQRVKAWIATTNVYGVDLNPTAIELGKLSLWLNVIHRDMEVPYFGYRLAAGNAVIGAWLRAYSWDTVKFTPIGNKGNKWEDRKWWERPPAPLHFKKDGQIDRRTDQIYHFLLPDPGMAAAAGLKLFKEEYAAETKAVGEWRKEFCKPLRHDEYLLLQRLCAGIDDLLDEHYRMQTLVNRYTAPRISFYGREIDQTQLPVGYEDKETLESKRYTQNAPYFKLKTILDYWCALWFWPPQQAADLPERGQWYADIARILDLDLQEADATDQETAPALDLFGKVVAPQMNLFEESRQSTLSGYRQKKTKDLTLDLIRRYTTSGDLFGDNIRLLRVREMAQQHRFFHPQVEFIEVFRERGGFDLIVGNPPWLKLTFEKGDIFGEKYPELIIRSADAPEMESGQENFFLDANLKNTYHSEIARTTATSTFLSASANYPLLEGQQNNLYKCILENAFSMISSEGFIGLLHPDSVYDDPEGRKLRVEIYQRLKFHFHFINELKIFSEISHTEEFSTNVYSGKKSKPEFYSIHNLFHPSTIDGCFLPNSKGLCGAKKVMKEDGSGFTWNTRPHKDRLIQFTSKELLTISKAFENSEAWDGSKLVSMQSSQTISVLEQLGKFQKSINDFSNKVTVCWDETNDVNKGKIIKKVKLPSLIEGELIYNGPHIHIALPFYKTPRDAGKGKSDFDVVDLTSISEFFLPQTNYIPGVELIAFKESQKGLQINSKEHGEPVFDRWIDHYKLGFRKMLAFNTERSLFSAILLPDVSHVNGIISVIFKDNRNLVEAAGITASVVMDFFIKTVGKSNLYDETIQNFPLGIPAQYRAPLYVRTLLLNCLTRPYEPLWQEMWDDHWRSETWSKPGDERLPSFERLGAGWDWHTPLRSAYARRMALVEIDVLVAMALGLNLDELILLYTVQFPVLQQNEADTWYDRHGNIVFTCSKGLNGVGLDRPQWDAQREQDRIEHTIEKSELYRGKKMVYEGPWEKCDRVEDYRRAWDWFINKI